MKKVKAKSEIKRKIFCIIAGFGCLFGGFVSFMMPRLTYFLDALLYQKSISLTGYVESYFDGFNITTLMFLWCAIFCVCRVFSKKVHLWPMVVPFFIILNDSLTGTLMSGEEATLLFVQKWFASNFSRYLSIGVVYFLKALFFLSLIIFVIRRKKMGRFLWLIPVFVLVAYGWGWSVFELANHSKTILQVIQALCSILLSSSYIIATLMCCLGVAKDSFYEQRAVSEAERLAEETTEEVVETVASESVEEVALTVENE